MPNAGNPNIETPEGKSENTLLTPMILQVNPKPQTLQGNPKIETPSLETEVLPPPCRLPNQRLKSSPSRALPEHPRRRVLRGSVGLGFRV